MSTPQSNRPRSPAPQSNRPHPPAPPLSENSDPQPSAAADDLSFWQQFCLIIDTMSVEYWRYMLVARPLLWLSALVFTVFVLSGFAEALHGIWWDIETNPLRQLVAGLPAIVILLVGICLHVYSRPRGDHLFAWRVVVSLFCVAGGLIFGSVRGWLPSLAELIDYWFLEQRYYDWLRFCTINSGALWLLLEFIGIVVKVCFWPAPASDPKSS